MRNPYLVGLTAVLLALSACSEDEDKGPSAAEATAPAKLETPEDVGKAIALVKFARDASVAADYTGFDFAGERDLSKRSVSDDCSIGGGYSFSDEGGTTSENDFFSFSFTKCIEPSREYRGVLAGECLQGEFGDDCSSFSMTFGSMGNSPFFERTSSTERQVLGNWAFSSINGVVRLLTTLELRDTTLSDGSETLLISDDFSLRSQVVDGDSELIISGTVGLGFDDPDTDCNGGQITITPISPLLVDNGVIRDGRVELSNDPLQSSGARSAEVTFNADGSVDVTLNGQTTPLSRALVESYCRF